MLGSGLKKLASEYQMNIESGVAYGWMKGCFLSLSEGVGYKRMAIYIGSHHAPEEQVALIEGEVPAHMKAADAVADYILEKAGSAFKTYRLMPQKSKTQMPAVVLAQGGSVVLVNFYDNPGTLKCIRNFIEDVLPGVASMTTPRECSMCGGQEDSTFRPMLLSDQAVVPMHSGCADKIEEALRSIKENTPSAFPLLPILGALIGALLGAVVWALIGIAGYIASIVGFLIAFLASKGYDLLGGKPGKLKLIILIICVILAVFAGTAGAQLYFIHDYYQEAITELKPWEEAIPEMEFIQAMIPALLDNSEFIGSIAKDIGLGLLFAALGCFKLVKLSGSTPEEQNKPKALNGRWE